MVPRPQTGRELSRTIRWRKKVKQNKAGTPWDREQVVEDDDDVLVDDVAGFCDLLRVGVDGMRRVEVVRGLENQKSAREGVVVVVDGGGDGRGPLTPTFDKQDQTTRPRHGRLVTVALSLNAAACQAPPRARPDSPPTTTTSVLFLGPYFCHLHTARLHKTSTWAPVRSQ